MAEGNGWTRLGPIELFEAARAVGEHPEGLDSASNGVLYSSEHGPKTDDEINILTSGSNYGWPHVAGFQDNKAYKYARWADSSTPPCSQLKYDDTTAIPSSVPKAGG